MNDTIYKIKHTPNGWQLVTIGKDRKVIVEHCISEFDAKNKLVAKLTTNNIRLVG